MADLSMIKPLLKARGIKVRDFCERLGITEQGFAKILRQNSTKIETLEQIAEQLDVPVSTFFADDAVQVNGPMLMNVPVVPVYAQAGYLRGFGDEEYLETLPTLPVVTDRNYKGHYRIFEISGDSMDDGSAHALLSGDKVLARDVRQDLWQSRLHIRNWYFIIVHRTEGILVKQIVSHDVDHGVITCHSLNPMFDDFDLNLSDVAQLYNVVSLVSREMRL
ncbi:MAG: XRE family transcriptional regulator [Candidatus Aphodosoma sp.]